jgi:predicted Ser/Thr protein kinase
MTNSSPSGPTRDLADLAFGSQTHVLDTSRPLAWLSPEEMAIDLADPVQRRFGDYELVEKIGQGGMGVVYRARQHGLERDVALKLLAAGPWASAEFVERFRREARSAARMQHPNIVEIYEFGHRDGLNYFSMRLIDGQSLAEKLQADGAMAPKDAARLLRTLAEAMDYAHRLGVLHLDLKPANVLLTKSGEPLIADFGLARRIDAGHEGGSEISGTPSYMAPEQAQLESHPLTASTDIWGLGAILYECLTGRPPFLGGSAQSTLERVISDTPLAPRQIRKAIPADLEAICLKCLAKDPNERYPTAREMAEDLANFLASRPVTVRTPDLWERTQRWWEGHKNEIVMFAILLGGIVATTKEMLRADTERERAEQMATAAQASSQKVEAAIGLLSSLTAATEGDQIDSARVMEMVALVKENLREKPEVGAELFEMLGRNLTHREPQSALLVLDAAYELALQAHGPSDERTQGIMRLHGWAAHNTGDLAASESYYRRYLAHLASTNGSDSVQYAHWSPHLALVLLDTGRAEEAEQWSRPALATLEQKHGPQRDWTMLAAYALGRSLLDQGRPREAIEPLRRSAETYEQLYSYDVGIAIYARYYLGLALVASGDTAQGNALVARSLEEATGHFEWKLMGLPLTEAVRARQR